MIKGMAVVTLILFIVTMGCGFAIHFGGEAFREGIKGHMVLGVMTLIALLVLVFSVYKIN